MTESDVPDKTHRTVLTPSKQINTPLQTDLWHRRTSSKHQGRTSNKVKKEICTKIKIQAYIKFINVLHGNVFTPHLSALNLLVLRPLATCLFQPSFHLHTHHRNKTSSAPSHTPSVPGPCTHTHTELVGFPGCGGTRPGAAGTSWPSQKINLKREKTTAGRGKIIILCFLQKPNNVYI